MRFRTPSRSFHSRERLTGTIRCTHVLQHRRTPAVGRGPSRVQDCAPKRSHFGGAKVQRRRTWRTARLDLELSTDRLERSLNTERKEAKEARDPADHADPIDPIEKKEPIEPIEQAEPIDPMESTDPVEPIESTESVEPMDQRERDGRPTDGAPADSQSAVSGSGSERIMVEGSGRALRPSARRW